MENLIALGYIGSAAECSSLNTESTLGLAILGAVLLVIAVLIFARAYQWAKYPKSASKKNEAIQHIKTGITIFILAVVVYMLFNVVISALRFPNIICDIPTLKTIESS